MLEILIPSLTSILTLTAIGLVFGLILSVSKLKLKVERDPRIEAVNEALPGANCGACGLPGCSAYATRIVEDDYAIDLCPVGGKETEQKIAEIMGKEARGQSVSLKALVHCQGGVDVTNDRFVYRGPKECAAANDLMGGFKVCEYGCLGFGDCVRACPFDAIHMGDDRIPVVDRVKCVGCGKCVTACPRDIITLAPEEFEVRVMCLNREKTPVMKKGCTVGCIGCKRCEKACRQVFEDHPEHETAIEVNDFIAKIDYSICINCLKCAEVCPVPVIDPVTVSEKYKKQQEKEQEKAEAGA